MTLLTPPSTSHRSEKESSTKFTFSVTMNVDLPKLAVTNTVATSSASTDSPLSASSSSRNVIWSPQNSYHSLGTPPKPRPSTASSNAMVKDRPIKPILKRRRVSPLNDATNEAGPSCSVSQSSSEGLFNLPEDLDSFFRQREATPEPSDPLCDLTYLDYPVSLILKPDAKLRELTEGYSILSARLRGTVQFSTDADASWPLFQPLRKNQAPFVDCVVRDLQRAFVDPIKSPDCPKGDEDSIPDENWDGEESKTRSTSVLPSPKKSPKKPKKKGMSAEQVKFARDLCTTSHAVIKLLCVFLCYPAIHNVFEAKQLRAILGALLSIPMANDLPTPNARKTCALAIMALQCQRLPPEILMPARDRIALALKRGIDGELGKEGKKGSANDGLKAIGDLSIYQPLTFVPVFAKATVLPSILQNLIAPTVALRLQACHALGGLAYALAGVPPSNIHVAASEIVADFILTVSPSTPTKRASPNKDGTTPLSPIMRTLRTTMNAQDATNVAQSPVWALCVCASLIVLLGSKMYTDRRVCMTIVSVFKLGAKHKKAAVRHLFCAAWRAVNWAWFQPDYDLLKGDEGESEREDDEESEKEEGGEKKDSPEVKRKTREAYFTIVQEIVETQAALSTAAAMLSCPPPPISHLGIQEDPHDDALRRALVLLDAMANSPNPETISDAAESLLNLVTPSEDKRDFTQPSKLLMENARPLLPRLMFAFPPTNGVLAADLTVVGSGSGSLMSAVRALFTDFPGGEELRALRRDEMRKPWVWDGLLKVWKSVVSTLEMTDDAQLPAELSQVWESLLLANVSILQEEGRDTNEVSILQEEGRDTNELALRAVDVLVDIFCDSALNFTVKSLPIPQSATSSATAANAKEKEQSFGPTFFTNGELKMKIVNALWSTIKTVFPRADLGSAAEKLLQALLDNCQNLTVPRRKKIRSISSNNNHIVAPIHAWASLCATVILDVGCGETEAMKMFWEIGVDVTEAEKSHWDALPVLENCETKSSVWKCCIDVWRREEGCWEGAVVLLAAPFVGAGSSYLSDGAEWSLSSEEGVKWKEFYDYALNKALDYGLDASPTTIIDCVAEVVSANMSTWTCPASLIQASDLLLDHLEPADMREVPVHLVNLLHATLKNAYPVKERNLSPAGWFIQTLTRLFENSPKELVRELVEGVGESVTVWLRDQHEVWSEDALDYTFLPLYQHLLLRIQTLPRDLEFLSTISPLLDSVFSGRPMPAALRANFKEAFDKFWDLSGYSKMEEPAEGWPLPVRHCLGLIDEVEPVNVVVETRSVLEAPGTPSRKVHNKGADGTLVFPRTPMAAMNGSNIPSPRRPHKPHADPHDPYDPPLPFENSPLSPVRRRRVSSGAGSNSDGHGRFGGLEASPFSRHGGIRFPAADSPTKRRRSLDLEDEDRDEKEKENSSPIMGSPKRRRTAMFGSGGARIPAVDFAPPLPVHERIAKETSGTGSSEKEKEKKSGKLRDRMGSAKGKVKNGDAKKGLSVRKPSSKRARSPSPASSDNSSQGSTDSEDERGWVERELVPFPSSDPPASASVEDKKPVEPQTPSTKKRKRLSTSSESGLISASELLEVSRAKSKRKLGPSGFDSSETGRIPSAWMTPLSSGRIMRKSHTVGPKTGGDLMNMARLLRRGSDSGVAKFADYDNENDNDDPFETEVMTDKPLPALRIHSPQVSDATEVDTRTLTHDSSSDGPSSDDSQHLGQVTPHHLISPQCIPRTSKVYASRAAKASMETNTTVVSSSLSLGSGSKLSATSQVLRGSRSSVDLPGSDDSLDGLPDSSPTRKFAERRRALGLQRLPSLTLKRV